MVMSKSVDSHLEVAQRLLANVDADTSDQADAPMKVPASAYRDAATRALDALGDDHFRFGRNEVGNQHVHRTIDQLVGAGAGPA